MNAITGTVYLVGSGPGAPKMITLEAKEILERAEVIIYDSLIDPTILKMASNSIKMKVGKRRGYHTFPQHKITKLLLSYAYKYQIIVRLKGGDPFIFGRGGEEMKELISYGVKVFTIPGVTTATGICALNNIPLTHRSYTSSVKFISGHERLHGQQVNFDLEQVVFTKEMIVIYMGIHNLSVLIEKMIKAGKCKETPITVVRWGSWKYQRQLEGTLATILAQMYEKDFGPPAIAIIGPSTELVPPYL